MWPRNCLIIESMPYRIGGIKKVLNPIILELGGKNPVFVTKNAHIKSAAMRIALVLELNLDIYIVIMQPSFHSLVVQYHEAVKYGMNETMRYVMRV